MSRIGSKHSMPDAGADKPTAMSGQPQRVGGGTTEKLGHAHQTGAACNETAEDKTSMILEEVLRRENMLQAFRRVVKNAGAAGVDGMTTDELNAHLQTRWHAIREELLNGTYQPQPVLKVTIPKPDGGTRALGIPTVVDRLIQQAVLQILQPHFDVTFSRDSYGFRPGKSAHQAIDRACEHIADGYRWVVDIDLEKFFDRVNHDVLMARLARHIADKRILHLIRLYLQAGMMEDGLVSQRVEGTPQGGPLSPLLSNVLLDELDKELERRGHRFARYADDCNIYVKSKTAGERVMTSVERFLNEILRLKINRAKSAVDRPWNRKFLGYTVTTNYQPKLKVSRPSILRLKDKLREMFRQGRGRSLRQVIKQIVPVMRGWMGYYRKVHVKNSLEELDQWIRRKLRCILWRQWKRPKTRYRELLKRGMGLDRARRSAANGHGPWWNAGSSHMNQALPTRMLHQLGLVSFNQESQRLACLS